MYNNIDFGYFYHQHGEPATPSTKSRRKFRLRKHKSSKSTGGEIAINTSPGKGTPDQVDAVMPSLVGVNKLVALF